MPKTKRTASPTQPQSAADVLWCYLKLDDPSVRKADAPSAGAWNLLLWSRESRTRFFTTVLPRSFPPVEPEEEVCETGDRETGSPDTTMRGYLLRRCKREDELRICNIPDELVADVRQVVDDFNELCRNRLTPGTYRLPPEAVDALTSHLSFAVHTAVLLAQKRPEIFADEVRLHLADCGEESGQGLPELPSLSHIVAQLGKAAIELERVEARDPLPFA